MVTSLASDTFTGSNGAAWSSAWANGQLSTGASFQIQSNVGRVTTASAGTYGGVSTQKVNISNPTNQVWLMKFRWPTGDECYPQIWMRASNDILDVQAGYFFDLNRPAGEWAVGKSTSYTLSGLGGAADPVSGSFSFASNTWYWVRCGVVGSSVKFKLWADGVSEPGAWTYEVTDATYAGAGRCGLRVGPGNVGSAKFEIDDFNLDDDFQLSFSDTAVLSGSGALTKSVVPRPTGAPGPSGAGALTVAGVPAFAVTAALAGAGALTTTRTPAMPGAAALSGSGSLAVTGTPAVTGAAVALAGAGTLSVGGAPALPGTATRTGSGTLTIAAGPAPADTATRTGSGTLTATGVPKPVVTAVTDAEGQLAVTPTPAIPGAAAQTGIGVLAVDVLPGLTGTVTRTGSGALVASGVPTPSAQPVLAGSGALSFAGVIGFSGAAGPAGVGALTTSRTPALLGTAALAGSGVLTASGVPKPSGTATLSGTGGLLAVGTPHIPGTAVLAGAGALTAAVVPTPAVTLALAGAGTLTLARTPAIPGAAVLTGSGALAVALSGQRGTRGIARLGVPAARLRLGPDTPITRGTTLVALSGSGSLAAVGTRDPAALAALAGAGALAAGGVPAVTGTATLAGSGVLAAAGLPALTGTAALGGAGGLGAVGTPGGGETTPTFVQAASANSGTASVATQNVTLPAPATAGNLILVCANSDSTIATPSGFTLAASAISNQACYLWWKIAAGGETTITLTPAVGRPVAAGVLEYSGIAGSPVDQSVTNASAGSTTGPVSAGTTGSTVQAAELVVAVTGPHSFADSAQPASPSWSGGFTGRLSTATAYATNGQNSAVFAADLVVAVTGTQTTSTSWTNSAQDWGAVIATFKGA